MCHLVGSVSGPNRPCPGNLLMSTDTVDLQRKLAGPPATPANQTRWRPDHLLKLVKVASWPVNLPGIRRHTR